jgi:peptidoglycan/LPS O-acetylase OafA/YrhL
MAFCPGRRTQRAGSSAVAQAHWQAPRILKPLLKLGQCSYEVYLTHVFVVLGLFNLFVAAGNR